MSGKLSAGLLSITLASCSPAGQSHRDTSSRGDTHRPLASSPHRKAATIDGFRKQLGERNDKQTRIHVLPIGEGNTAVILELEGEKRPTIWFHFTGFHSSDQRDQRVEDYLFASFVHKRFNRRSPYPTTLYSVTGTLRPNSWQSLAKGEQFLFFPMAIWSVMQNKIHSEARSLHAGHRVYWQSPHEEYRLRVGSLIKFDAWSASPLRSLTDPLVAYDLLLTKQDSTACLLLVPDPLMLGDTRRQCDNQIELSDDTFRLTLRNKPAIEFPVSSSISVVDLGTSVESSRPVLHQLPLP